MSKNIVFNFNEMSNEDKATKTIKKNFNRSGVEVVQVDVLPSLKRTSGISYRELSIIFSDSQVVVLRVKQSGDIYQVLINNKVKPVVNQDDQLALINEISKALQNGRTAFQKKQAKARAKMPSGIKTTVPTKTKLLEQKKQDLLDAITEAKKQLSLVHA